MGEKGEGLPGTLGMRCVGQVRARFRDRAPVPLTSLRLALVAAECELQPAFFRTEPRLAETALEGVGIALQGVEGFRPLDPDPGPEAAIGIKLEGDLDMAEVGRLELDDDALDLLRRGAGDLDGNLLGGNRCGGASMKRNLRRRAINGRRPDIGACQRRRCRTLGDREAVGEVDHRSLRLDGGT